MSSSLENNPSIATLIAVMSEQLKTLLKNVDNIEKKLDSKVDLTHFEKLEKSFEDHRRETNDKITEHTIKIGIGAGILTALSWVAHFLK